MKYQLQVTLEALNRMTPAQFDAIKKMLITYDHQISVYVAFELPEGYVGFTHHYPDGHSIYGGVAMNGEVST